MFSVVQVQCNDRTVDLFRADWRRGLDEFTAILVKDIDKEKTALVENQLGKNRNHSLNEASITLGLDD
jgi:hypothetical protein